jgi:hypothetical protein
VTACGDRQRVRCGAEIGAIDTRSLIVPAGRDGEIVMLRRLVIDLGDDAGGLCTELILHCRVRVAIRKQADVLGGVV